MTTRNKYVLGYLGGVVLWGTLFYLVGYRCMQLDPRLVLNGFLILAFLLGLGQWAIYYNERIRNYALRLQYVVCVSLAAGIVLAGLLFWWGFSGSSLSWPLQVGMFLTGLLISVGGAWLAYRTALHRKTGQRTGGFGQK